MMSARPGELSMVEVPAGRVRLHDRRTEHTWEADVAAFTLGATSVTRWHVAELTGRQPGSSGAAGLPVVEVTWWDALTCCNAISKLHGLEPAYDLPRPPGRASAVIGSSGYRLPTEAEWEHACRAGTTGPRYGQLDDIAWYNKNSAGRIHQVATMQPNAFGLHDMLGNVWEWCWDLYDPQVYGTYRVLRGGGWADPHWSVRASVRRRSHPAFQIDDVGFRVARSVP